MKIKESCFLVYPLFLSYLKQIFFWTFSNCVIAFPLIIAESRKVTKCLPKSAMGQFDYYADESLKVLAKGMGYSNYLLMAFQCL